MLQFDNVHLARDNKTVPSDLEQMPTLMSFLKDNGVLASNDHTQLISHTADGIVTTLTGVYLDRHGEAVSNAFGFFNAMGRSDSRRTASAMAHQGFIVVRAVDPRARHPAPDQVAHQIAIRRGLGRQRHHDAGAGADDVVPEE